MVTLLKYKRYFGNDKKYHNGEASRFRSAVSLNNVHIKHSLKCILFILQHDIIDVSIQTCHI